MKNILIVLVFIISQTFVYGDTPCDLYFEYDTSNANYIEVDVKVSDFVEVYGFQMFIQWDSTVLEFDSITFFQPSLDEIFFNPNLTSGVLSSGWSDIFLNTGTFEDSTTLFTIKYKYIGDPCDNTTLELIDYSSIQQSLITYEYEGDTYEAPIRFTPGAVAIPGTCGSTSISDFNNKSIKIEVYPNPVVEELNISINSDIIGKYKLEVFTPQGVLLEKKIIIKSDYNTVFNYKLNNNNIHRWLFLRVTNSKISKTHKIIIGSR